MAHRIQAFHAKRLAAGLSINQSINQSIKLKTQDARRKTQDARLNTKTQDARLKTSKEEPYLAPFLEPVGINVCRPYSQAPELLGKALEMNPFGTTRILGSTGEQAISHRDADSARTGRLVAAIPYDAMRCDAANDGTTSSKPDQLRRI